MGFPRRKGGVADPLVPADGTQNITGALAVSGAVSTGAGDTTTPGLTVGSAAVGLAQVSTNAVYKSTDEHLFYFGTTAHASLTASGGTFLAPAAAFTNTYDLGVASTREWKDAHLAGFYYRSVTTGITASTTQTQVAATALTTEYNVIGTCTNANDAAKLPAAAAGKYCFVQNSGAQTLQLFPASGDNLGAGVDASTTIAAAAHKIFQAYDDTNWKDVT